MKIQINRQTQDGVWGHMVTVWRNGELVASQWFGTLP